MCLFKQPAPKKMKCELEFPEVHIKHLIYWSEGEYIIAIDHDNDIDWETKDCFAKELEDQGIVAALNRLGSLEAIPTKEWTENLQMSLKRMLGEGLARAFQSQFVEANKIFDDASKFIQNKAPEVSRYWSIQASIFCLFILFILILVCLVLRVSIILAIEPTPYFLCLASILGGIGAVSSILSRIGKVNVNPYSGKLLHYFENFARVAAGCISGMIGGLAIKSGLIFTALYESHPNISILLCGFACGLFERLVPSMILKMGSENSDSSHNKKTEGGQNDQ